MPDQCYFEGDFYQCIYAADANESPETNPEKWEKLKIPVEWRRVLVKLTYAHLLQLDGQTDKALVERASARSELEDLVRYAANRDGWRARPNVFTR